jgi:UDP-glucose:tetrahydrobiopterin glucosyltransferase
MRVALIAPLVSPIADPQQGGAQAVVADLARALLQRGHDVSLFASEGSIVPGVSVCTLGIESAPLQGATYRHDGATVVPPAMVAAYRAIYEQVRGKRFDVIHNHGFDPPAVTVAAEHGLSVLHTLHLPPTEAMIQAISDARAGGAVVWCATVSRAAETSWQSRVAVDGMLPNGVPVQSIRFAVEGGSGAVIASRFSPEKGMAEGVTAARRAGLACDVYGTPYDREYETAVRLAWQHDQLVAFHSPLDREALWIALGRAAVVLCLSRWEEPFGLVAAEAQAAGTPVIASARGGLRDVVRHGVTGFVVNPDDSDEVAGALANIGQISRVECRDHAERDLALATSVARHEDLYARCAVPTPAAQGPRA